MLPALSVAVQETVLLPTLDVSTAPQLAEAMSDKLSEAFGEAVAVPPSKTGFGATVGASVGAVASRLTVTLSEDVPPALVAEQVKVASAVSSVTLTVSQPL